MSSPEIPRRRRRTPTCLPLLECYLSSILDIAEAIEAISPEISPSYRERLCGCMPVLAANRCSRKLSNKAAGACTKFCAILPPRLATTTRPWPAI